jgi:O-antigen/teichoic acid export membrane protein
MANLIASATIFLFMLPELRKVQWNFDWLVWKKMLRYAFPLVIVGIAGNINQVFAAPLQKFFLGEDTADNLAVAGKYMGPAKIALLLNLFTVAFNYAAEPFFFNNVGKENSEKAYGQIIHAFTIVAGTVMVGIVCFQEIAILIIGKSYRGPQEIIPILLFAYFFLGLYYNVSIWYKLSDKTIYGALISIGGAIITLGISIGFLARVGYIASAWASLACFSFMLIAGYLLGQKHYPIEYPVMRILKLITLIAAAVIGTIVIKSYIGEGNELLALGAGLIIFLFFALLIYVMEKDYIIPYLKSS